MIENRQPVHASTSEFVSRNNKILIEKKKKKKYVSRVTLNVYDTAFHQSLFVSSGSGPIGPNDRFDRGKSVGSLAV